MNRLKGVACLASLVVALAMVLPAGATGPGGDAAVEEVLARVSRVTAGLVERDSVPRVAATADSLQPAALSDSISPREMASTMMRDTAPRAYQESWWDTVVDLYMAHPVLTLLAAIAVVIALSWLFKKIFIALI